MPTLDSVSGYFNPGNAHQAAMHRKFTAPGGPHYATKTITSSAVHHTAVCLDASILAERLWQPLGHNTCIWISLAICPDNATPPLHP